MSQPIQIASKEQYPTRSVDDQAKIYADVRRRLRGDPKPRTLTIRRTPPAKIARLKGETVIRDVIMVASSNIPLASMTLIETIIAKVALKSGVTIHDIKSARRNKETVIARQEAIYLVRQNTSKSMPEIGRIFGGRDHTTVLSSIRRHEQRIAKKSAERASEGVL